jgi:hypothetical protein
MKLTRWLFPITYLTTIGLLKLHAFFPQSFVIQNPPLSIEEFAIVAIFINAIVFWVTPKHDLVMNILRNVFTPLIAAFTILALIVESLTYSNFVYSHVHFDPRALILLSFFGLGIYAATLTREAFKKNFGTSLTLLGNLAMHAVFLKWYDYSLYNSLSGEDKFFENLTFFIYMIGAAFFIQSAHRLWGIKKKTLLTWMVIIYVLLGAIGYTGIAGEEISWGQRVLGFDTPQEYRENNSQGEFNLHNNEKIFNKIYIIYGSICMYVILSALAYMSLNKRFPKKHTLWFRMLTFRWYHIAYFVPTLIYVSYRLYFQTSAFDVWEESTEVLFALGMMLYAIHVMHVVRKEFSTK